MSMWQSGLHRDWEWRDMKCEENLSF
jgi:hypothetical protein